MAAAGPGDDYSSASTASKWKVFTYNKSERNTSGGSATIKGGTGFNFVNRPDTTLMGTSANTLRGTILGDLTGMTVQATFTIDATPGTTYSFYGQGDPASDPGTVPANVRLYFETNSSTYDDPSLAYAQARRYWWSNPVSSTLVNATGNTVTLTVPLSPEMWSNWLGGFGSDPANTAAFYDAVQHVSFIGLSFGGGFFFENGVGVSSGKATFRLLNFSVSPTVNPPLALR